MRTYANQLVLFLALSVAAFAQRTDLPGTTVLQGTTSTGSTNSSLSITGDFGGTVTCGANGVCGGGGDNGNNGNYFASGFLTPSTIPILIPTCYTYMALPAAPLTVTFASTSPVISATNTFYAGQPVTFTTTGSLPVNFAVLTTYFVISTGLSGSQFEVSATVGGSSISTTSSLGSGTQSATYVYGCGLYNDTGNKPDGGSFICGGWTGATGSLGYNAVSMTSCPSTLSANTKYWWVQFTTSSTQDQGTSGAGNCPGIGIPSVYALTVVGTGSSPYPATFPTSTVALNGCYSTYGQLTYTTPLKYNVISFDPATCDVNGTCSANFPPSQAGDKGLVITYGGVSGAPTFTAVKDCVFSVESGCSSSIDTVTKEGSCSNASGTQTCFWWIGSLTTGISQVSGTTSGLSKGGVVFIELQGTTSTPDQVVYDTAYSATPFTGTATGTTTNPTEFAIAAIYNALTYTAGAANFVFTATSPWTLEYTGALCCGSGGASTIGVFTQTLAGTQTVQAKGSFATAGTDNQTAVLTIP